MGRFVPAVGLAFLVQATLLAACSNRQLSAAGADPPPLAGRQGLDTEGPAGSGAGGSAESLVPVGVASVDITPEEPIRLSGYGSRRLPSEGVAQRLYAKALAFGSDGERPAVLITADLIGIPGTLRERLARRLQERVGLEPAQLALLATHTHTGPFLLGSLPNIFGEAIPPDHLVAIHRYTQRLEKQLEQLALDALAAREPARLEWARGEVSFAANRRVIENGEWTGFGVTPGAPVDHDLPVLRVTRPGGELRAVLVSYASHATTLGGQYNQIHGDWPGAAQERIEAAHPGAVAMVAIGTGADSNPHPRGSVDDVWRHGEAIAAEVERVLAGPMRPVRAAPEGRYREIELPYDPAPSIEEFAARAGEEGATGYHARQMLDRYVRQGELPSSLEYPIQTWVFGDDLAMIFLAGEVVVDYGLRLKRELDRDRVWVNAYANDLPSYIASKRIMPEGGYEVDRSMMLYDRPTRLSEDVEDLIVHTVKELLPASYRAGR